MTKEQNMPSENRQKRADLEKKPMQFPLESFLRKLKDDQRKKARE
ncbi:hypothetical protein [Martelella alba]|nr:hypothetical protein [Martelella alba]